MITVIDRATAKFLHEAADKVLADLAKQHGLGYKSAAGSYDPSNGTFTTKGVFMIQSLGGVDRERFEFEQYASMFGFTAQHYKTRFTALVKVSEGPTEYELIGFNPSKPKYCILARHVGTGKVVNFAESVRTKIPGYLKS